MSGKGRHAPRGLPYEHPRIDGCRVGLSSQIGLWDTGSASWPLGVVVLSQLLGVHPDARQQTSRVLVLYACTLAGVTTAQKGAGGQLVDASVGGNEAVVVYQLSWLPSLYGMHGTGFTR